MTTRASSFCEGGQIVMELGSGARPTLLGSGRRTYQPGSPLRSNTSSAITLFLDNMVATIVSI